VSNTHQEGGESGEEGMGTPCEAYAAGCLRWIGSAFAMGTSRLLSAPASPRPGRTAFLGPRSRPFPMVRTQIEQGGCRLWPSLGRGLWDSSAHVWQLDCLPGAPQSEGGGKLGGGERPRQRVRPSHALGPSCRSVPAAPDLRSSPKWRLTGVR
jgi:hypothetical protein